MSRLRSYEPERVEMEGGHEAWITPAFAAKGWEDWYAETDDRAGLDPNPPLPAEAVFAMLAAGITAWSLTDDDGDRLPVNLESVTSLTWATGKPLVEWCNALISGAALEQIQVTSRAMEGER